jgi:hypothetical protein
MHGAHPIGAAAFVTSVQCKYGHKGDDASTHALRILFIYRDSYQLQVNKLMLVKVKSVDDLVRVLRAQLSRSALALSPQ